MKQLIFITCLLICVLCGGYSQNGTVPKKSMSLSFIEIVQEGKSIDLYFNQSLGVVTIRIINSEGITIFQNISNALQGTCKSINTALWHKNIYIVCIEDSNGFLLKELLYYKE